MDVNQIVLLLRAVVSDELDGKLLPINDSLTALKSDVTVLKIDMSQVKGRLEVKAEQQHEDTMGLLKPMDGKLHTIQSDLEFGYKKIAAYELDLNRLRSDVERLRHDFEQSQLKAQ